MANFNFNKVILGGRLTADPELRTTASGISVTSFGIAVNRRFGGKNGEDNQTDFFNVTAWRTTGEFVSRYFRKGSSICVVGSIQNRQWTDQNGQKRYSTDIIADEVMFVDSKSDNPAAQTASAQPYVPEAYNSPAFSTDAAAAPKFEELGDDEDLPF